MNNQAAEDERRFEGPPSVQRPPASELVSTRKYLVNVDNGGTLTDVCVIDGDAIHRAKTLTTPHDLSECVFEGLRRVSTEVYGLEDLPRLLREAELIRYSTTQGTNALVERKGPRLGFLANDANVLRSVTSGGAAAALHEALVGNRTRAVDPHLDHSELDAALVAAVNELTAAGANRIVVAFSGEDYVAHERRAERILVRRFPTHLLGTVPLLLSHEIVDDANVVRRAWSALLNAYLHPAMERFLYEAERRLREHRIRAPLLIFRNDGGSARVAKTVALRTYGSGPRGGMEGVRALAAHYGLSDVVSIDVGGTTTDVGQVRDGAIRSRVRGSVEGIEISFPLADVVSAGVGGSSVVRTGDGQIVIGPESVGSVPGPACFGRGGIAATATDAFLVLGVLDPATFFGGTLHLDPERARRAVGESVARPLGLDPDRALAAIERAWVGLIAAAVRSSAVVSSDTVLAIFGGAGPLGMCGVADLLGARRILVPGLASVFSAVGIGFSDLSHEYEARVCQPTTEGVAAAAEDLLGRARRDVFAAGIDLDACCVEGTLLRLRDSQEAAVPFVLGGGVPNDLDPRRDQLSLRIRVSKKIRRATFRPVGRERVHEARSQGTRRALRGREWNDLPLYQVEELEPGAELVGPAILEEAYFTSPLGADWKLQMTENRDLLLWREGRAVS